MYKGYKKPSNPIDVTCANCGKQFQKFPGSHRLDAPQHFCNHACHKEWQQTNHPVGVSHPHYKSVEVPCSHCGKPLTRKPYRLRDYKEQFCNKKCLGLWASDHRIGIQAANWKGGWYSYYGPNWQRQATKTRKRDNHTCQHCGISETKLARKLDVHHIIPIREFGYIPGENENYRQANDLSNLIALCPPCHQKTEHEFTSPRP